MKGTEQDDEEFEMLLGEIPRATSAPPHLEDMQRVVSSISNDESPKGELNSTLQREDGLKTSNYENLYEGYQNVSVSIGGNIVSLSPNSSSPLSPFYGGSPSDVSSGGGSSPQLLLDQRSQVKGTLQSIGQEQQISNVSAQQTGVGLSTQHIFTDPSVQQNGVVVPTQQHIFLDDQSLTAAFTNLSFKENGDGDGGIERNVKQVVQTVPLENGDGGLGRRVLDDEQDRNCSAGVYSAYDVIGMALPTHFNGVGGSLSSPRTTSSRSMYGVKYSSQFNHPNGYQVSLDEMSPPVQAQPMKKLLNCNAYGEQTYGNDLGLQFDNFSVGLVDARQSVPVYSAATPHAPGMQGYRPLPNASISGAELVSPIVNLQKQYYLDPPVGSYMHPQQCRPPVSSLHQKMNTTHLPWQHIEEESRMRMQQEYMLLQQAQTLAVPPNQVGAAFTGDSSNRVIRQQSLYSSMPNFPQLEPLFGSPQLQGTIFTEREWNTNLVPGMLGASSLNHSEIPIQSGNTCRYYAQGFCGRGESCPFFHGQLRTVTNGRNTHSGSIPIKDPRMVAVLEREEKPAFPEKILTRNRSRGINSITTINPAPSGGRKDSLGNGYGRGRALPNGYHSLTGPFQLDIQNHSRGVSSEITEAEIPLRTLSGSQQQQPKYTSLDEVQGRIYFIAKDQHGCRFLQRKFDEGSPEDVQKIFLEIIDHIIELMTDPFGNYLVQKLLEVCTEDQKMEILLAVTRKAGELVNISLNMHGTRAVQKLIEILKTPQQVSMVVSSLKPGVVTLIKDLNGNHVVQRCLQRLSNEDSQFLFDAAAEHCVEIATHRHGCCVLQRCIDYSTGAQRERLVAEIAANALVLSQDPFGNYVVQYILDLEIPWASVDVMAQLEGNCAYLSMQKFSSNVIEKCLKLSGDEGRACIVRELVNSSRLGQLLQDPFANYVVQSALTVSKGALHSALVDAIRPHLPALRSSPFGKRILSRTNLKK
eukprot:Gb_24858 [translate_table: standard]